MAIGHRYYTCYLFPKSRPTGSAAVRHHRSTDLHLVVARRLVVLGCTRLLPGGAALKALVVRYLFVRTLDLDSWHLLAFLALQGPTEILELLFVLLALSLAHPLVL